MTTSTGHKQLKRVIIFMLLLFAAVGASPVFSQQIIATFGFGGEFLDHKIPYEHKDTDQTVLSGVLMNANVLFVGRSGFTVSLGTDVIFKTGSDVGSGLNADPVLGFGYIYYNVLYFGGILNVIPKPYIVGEYVWNGSYYYGRKYKDVFITPTLIAGIDFGSFLLGAQVSYLIGANTGIGAFRFSIGAGVNVGSMW